MRDDPECGTLQETEKREGGAGDAARMVFVGSGPAVHFPGGLRPGDPGRSDRGGASLPAGSGVGTADPLPEEGPGETAEAPEESAGDEQSPSPWTPDRGGGGGLETAERMLTSLEDMSRWLKEALAEENCLVEEVAVTVNTAGGYTAQALAAGGVDVALLPAVDFIAWEEDAQALLVSGEDPCETVAAVTLSRPELDDAFCQTLAAALTETEAGEQFLTACRPDAVFASASEEALQAVRDYAADWRPRSTEGPPDGKGHRHRLLLLAALLLAALNFFFNFAHRRRRPKRQKKPAPPANEAERRFQDMVAEGRAWVEGHPGERVSATSFDGLRLQGLYFPADRPRACVLLFHGYRSTGLRDFGLLIPYYHNTGFSVLAVDQRACGESEGTYITFGVKERQDVLTWARYMDGRLGGQVPLVLEGLSLGAATVMMAADLPLPASVRGIIADCGFTSPWDIIAHCARLWYRLPALPWSISSPPIHGSGPGSGTGTAPPWTPWPAAPCRCCSSTAVRTLCPHIYDGTKL